MSADARQKLKDNLKYWADLDRIGLKNDFIRLYNISLNQDLDYSDMISVEECEIIYQNAKDLAFVFLENFDHFLTLIDDSNSFMQIVDNNTIILKEDCIKNTYTGSSNLYFSAMFNHLIKFKNYLFEILSQVRSASDKRKFG